MRKAANPWLRTQLESRGLSVKALAYLIDLPPSAPDWITEHVNRRRHFPGVERRLAAYFHLSVRQLRAALWPDFYAPRVRTRARAVINQESRPCK